MVMCDIRRGMVAKMGKLKVLLDMMDLLKRGKWVERLLSVEQSCFTFEGTKSLCDLRISMCKGAICDCGQIHPQ